VANGTITLSTNGGVTPYIYSWSNGATSEDLNNLAIGNYSLSITDANGCLLSQSFSVSGSSDISITLNSVDEGCGQPNSGSVDVTPNGGTLPLTYNWSNGTTTQDLIAISAGSYSVTVSDSNGCSTSASSTINSAFQPTLNASVLPSNARDTLITWGDLTSITGGIDQTTQGVTYTWTSNGPSNANFTTPTNINTEVEPDDDGIYQFIITAISSEGCITTDTLNVEVRANNPSIPTAFSPNGDGTNDNFSVINLDKKFIREFKVYNRWGELVYDNAEVAAWDGKFKGTEQPRDVYMYIISWESSTGNGDTVKRGQITLLR
jgi:gliding motility-associated-like protein